MKTIGIVGLLVKVAMNDVLKTFVGSRRDFRHRSFAENITKFIGDRRMSMQKH